MKKHVDLLAITHYKKDKCPKHPNKTERENMKNQNHPKRGTQTKVEPIRKLKDINLLKKVLEDKPVDYAFFVIGINTNLRASDLLQLKIKHVKDLSAGDDFPLKEIKTKKYRQIVWNESCVDAVKKILKSKHLKDDDYLFIGQRGRWTVPTVSRKVKSWCQSINLKGNYAAHSLRKTWGYHQFHTFHQPLPILTDCFNHSTQKQTLLYLCIQPKEIKDVFMNSL